MNVERAADWILNISTDLRAAGDVALVRLSDDGVGPDAISLADELYLVSVCVRNLGSDE